MFYNRFVNNRKRAATSNAIDDCCKAAFITAMNKKAASLGAVSSSFKDASGLDYVGSLASATDLLRILIHASGIPQIAEKWNKDSYCIAVDGKNARTENIDTSVSSSSYDKSSYPILGGKTGTIKASGYVNYNLMWCTQIAGKKVACVILGDSTDEKRWEDAQKLAIYIEMFLTGQIATLSIDAPCVAACILPDNPIIDKSFPLSLIASKAPTVPKTPASLTKIISLATAYDYITDEMETVEIHASDIIGGSGDNLKAGDIVTVRDLVYDMLLPSSNDAATALARHIGTKIIEMTNISIQRLEETIFNYGDIVNLLHLSFEERLEQGLHFSCSSISEEDYRKKMAKGTVLVAVLSNPEQPAQLVGTIAHRVFTDNHGTKLGYIEYLAIHPDMKRRGLGQNLLRDSLDILMEKGAEYVISTTAVGANSSVQCHKKVGFKIVGLLSYPATQYYSFLFRIYLLSDKISYWKRIVYRIKNSLPFCSILYLISSIKTRITRTATGKETRLLKTIKRIRSIRIHH